MIHLSLDHLRSTQLWLVYRVSRPTLINNHIVTLLYFASVIMQCTSEIDTAPRNVGGMHKSRDRVDIFFDATPPRLAKVRLRGQQRFSCSWRLHRVKSEAEVIKCVVSK